ncbi:MAG: hypothetical protein H8E37_03175, partial [Planctomycetes bacterium]|nr:hypothetical protein [Planctomycetota bacterium]
DHPGDGPTDDDDGEDTPGDDGGDRSSLRFGFNVKKYSSPAGSLEFTLIGDRDVCVEAANPGEAIFKLRQRFMPHIRPASAERISYRFFPHPAACRARDRDRDGDNEKDGPIRPVPDPGETERPEPVDIPTR